MREKKTEQEVQRHSGERERRRVGVVQSAEADFVAGGHSAGALAQRHQPPSQWHPTPVRPAPRLVRPEGTRQFGRGASLWGRRGMAGTLTPCPPLPIRGAGASPLRACGLLLMEGGHCAHHGTAPSNRPSPVPLCASVPPVPSLSFSFSRVSMSLRLRPHCAHSLSTATPCRGCSASVPAVRRGSGGGSRGRCPRSARPRPPRWTRSGR